jgi:ABC-type antimicrobial peptide transport system permease subunit
VIVISLLPPFNYLTGKHLTIESLNAPILFGIIGITLIVGMVSGSYPALFLSSFKPVAVLRGTFRQRSGLTNFFRKGLVVFQFGLAVLLIVSTVVVYLQLEYNRTRNLGLERDNLLFLPREGALLNRYDALAQELLMQPGIASVTASGQNPLEVGNNTLSVGWDGKNPDNSQLFYIINTYHDFVKTMNMELVAGRDFSKAFADSMAYIVNEEAAEMIGGSDNYRDVVGKILNVYGQSGPIVGVVKNFSMNSLYSPVEPVVARLYVQWAGLIYVRTKPGETQQALKSLKSVCRKFNEDYPLQYTFLDQQFEQRYRSEQVIGKLANIFAIIALFVSCLGLFGLTSFTVEQRTKELGVRRVLGATVSGIVVMLSKDFLRLVFIGFIFAIPVTWYITNQWLQNFADRIEIGAMIFLLAGFAVILVALATVSWQSIKAAIANPVDSLRNE